jgi:hypothetical protein
MGFGYLRKKTEVLQGLVFSSIFFSLLIAMGGVVVVCVWIHVCERAGFFPPCHFEDKTDS